MELTNEFEVSLPVDEAWSVLTDVERIAPCLPGAQLQEIEGDEYRGIVKVKVGPITAQYKGKALFVHLDEGARKAVLTASGRDTRGQGNANATITAELRPAGDATHVSLLTDLMLTGKVAQFGRGVLADVSAKLIDQFVENLESTVLSGTAAEPIEAAEEGAASPSGADAGSEPATPAKKKAPAKAKASAKKKAPAKSGAQKAKAAGQKTAANTPAKKKAAAKKPSSTEESAGEEVVDRPVEPVVRLVDHPEPEPVDLVGTAGTPLLKRLLPVFVVLGVVAFLLVRRRRRRRREA